LAAGERGVTGNGFSRSSDENFTFVINMLRMFYKLTWQDRIVSTPQLSAGLRTISLATS